MPPKRAGSALPNQPPSRKSASSKSSPEEAVRCKRAAFLEFLSSIEETVAYQQGLHDNHNIKVILAALKQQTTDQCNTDTRVAQLIWEIHEAAEAYFRETQEIGGEDFSKRVKDSMSKKHYQKFVQSISKVSTEKDSILGRQISNLEEQLKTLAPRHTTITTWYNEQLQKNETLQKDVGQLTAQLHDSAKEIEKLKAKLAEKDKALKEAKKQSKFITKVESE